jgi:hypothetical protein
VQVGREEGVKNDTVSKYMSIRIYAVQSDFVRLNGSDMRMLRVAQVPRCGGGVGESGSRELVELLVPVLLCTDTGRQGRAGGRQAGKGEWPVTGPVSAVISAEAEGNSRNGRNNLTRSRLRLRATSGSSNDFGACGQTMQPKMSPGRLRPSPVAPAW